MDVDDSGGLSFVEMQQGLLKLQPPISLTAEVCFAQLLLNRRV